MRLCTKLLNQLLERRVPTDGLPVDSRKAVVGHRCTCTRAPAATSATAATGCASATRHRLGRMIICTRYRTCMNSTLRQGSLQWRTERMKRVTVCVHGGQNQLVVGAHELVYYECTVKLSTQHLCTYAQQPHSSHTAATQQPHSSRADVKSHTSHNVEKQRLRYNMPSSFSGMNSRYIGLSCYTL